MTSPDIETILAQWRRWGINKKPKLLNPLAGGKTNQSYLLKAGNDHLVLKLYNQPDTKTKQSHLVQQAVNTIHLAPQLIYAATSNCYSVSTYINGSILNSAKPLNTVELTTLCKAIHCYQQLPLHLPAINYAALLGNYRQHLLKQQLWNGNLEQQFHLVISHCQALDEHYKGTAAVLAHHDLNPANIIFHKDTLEHFSFIDWEFSCASYPCFDYAIIFAELNVNENDLVKASGVSKNLLYSAADIYRYLCRLYWLFEKKTAQENAIK